MNCGHVKKQRSLREKDQLHLANSLHWGLQLPHAAAIRWCPGICILWVNGKTEIRDERRSPSLIFFSDTRIPEN